MSVECVKQEPERRQNAYTDTIAHIQSIEVNEMTGETGAYKKKVISSRQRTVSS